MTRAVVVFVLLIPLVLAARWASSGETRKEVLNRPDGHWTIGSGTSTVELRAKDGRLTWRISIASDGPVVTLTADYSVTKDSICYGIVTRIEFGGADEKMKEKLPELDDTFRFRFRVDDDEMNVRELKGKGFEQLKNAAGRYKNKPEPLTEKDRFREKEKGRFREKEK